MAVSEPNDMFNIGIITIFLMIMLYMGFAAVKEKYQLSFGHEASLVTLTGFIISWAAFKMNNFAFADMMSFNEQLFFYICLPPIVFASGFNMQRKDFFGNFRNVILFGIIGTFIAFFVFSGLTILYTQVIAKGEVYMTNGGTGETSILQLSIMEILIMCSLLCSTDTIAAISLLNPQKQPKLFSVVFGEGIVNDGVVIIMFNTIMKFADTEDSSFTV